MKLWETPGMLQLWLVILVSANYFHFLLVKWLFLRRDKNIYTVSQLLEVNDLSSHLTVDENRLLLAALSTYPHLQHKLGLLIHSMRRAPVVDKFVTQTTTASSLFFLDKYLSQISSNNNDTNYTRRFKSRHHTPLDNARGSPYHRGLNFLMPTKSSTCHSCPPKPRKQFSRYWTELSGHRIRHSSQDEHLTPFATGVRSRDYGTSTLQLWTLFGQNLGPSWKSTHSYCVSPLWCLHPSFNPHPFWNRV